MTYVAEGIYYPSIAVVPIGLGGYEGQTLNEAVSILMDEIREFFRDAEENSWWDDVTITIEHENVRTKYPFQYWAKHFGWSY